MIEVYNQVPNTSLSTIFNCGLLNLIILGFMMVIPCVFIIILEEKKKPSSFSSFCEHFVVLLLGILFGFIIFAGNTICRDGFGLLGKGGNQYT